MRKQAIVIVDFNGDPIQVCEVKDFESATEFLKFKTEIEKKQSKVIEESKEYIKQLEHRLLLVETELKYNRGEIDEKEFEELCGKK